MIYLSPGKLDEICALAISARLDRAELMRGVSSAFIESIPPSGNRRAQIFGDLHNMNARGRLEDGSFPLETWLQNAIHLLEKSGIAEKRPCEEALQELRVQRNGPILGKIAPYQPLPRLPDKDLTPPVICPKPGILDIVPYPWSDPRAQRLHGLLSSAYPAEAARLLARKCGMNLTYVDTNGAVGLVWERLLEAAASQRLLHKLVETVLSDQDVGAYHAALDDLIG